VNGVRFTSSPNGNKRLKEAAISPDPARHHGIGPVSLAVFHFDAKLFGGHSRHDPGKSGQTDFFP
jgi:hypothetical protein